MNVNVPDPHTSYRLSPVLAAKFVGLALAVVGVGIFAFTIVAAFVGAPFWVVMVTAFGLALLAVAGGVWAANRAYVLVLDDTGYRVNLVRGVGVRSARWADVKDAHTAEIAGSPCVVLRLRNGAQSVIPVEALAANRDEVVGDVRSRLLG